jgi:hypothetical protein
MSDPMIPPLNPTESSLAEEVRKIAVMLRNAALNPKQWNNLLANSEDLNDIWGEPDFLSKFHRFLVENLQTGNFDTWMRAIEKLSRHNYTDPDLKGFLKSVTTTKYTDEDLSDYDTFEKYIVENSDATLDENQRILFREKLLA